MNNAQFHQFAHDVKALMLGKASLAFYFSAELFALMALAISLHSHASTRPAGSPYSWRFLIMDNIKRIACGQIALFLIFRFATEILGRELDMWLAVVIGFGLSLGLDKFIQFLQSKAGITLFDQDRSKLAPPKS